MVLTYGFLDWKLNPIIIGSCMSVSVLHHFRYKEKLPVFRRGVVTYIVTVVV